MLLFDSSLALFVRILWSQLVASLRLAYLLSKGPFFHLQLYKKKGLILILKVGIRVSSLSHVFTFSKEVESQ